MPKKTPFEFPVPIDLRKARGENQTRFWQKYGVTQSGGSRYEADRPLPRPLALLFTLEALGRLTDADFAAANAALMTIESRPTARGVKIEPAA